MLAIYIPSYITRAGLHFGNDDSGSAGCGDTKPAEAKTSILVKRR